MKYRIPFLLILSLCWLGSQAQQDPKQQALSIIRQLAETYKSPQGLSFDISFRYSAERNRSVLLDSLAGQCRLRGDNYWYRIDSTESIRTPEYWIMFFKEDSLMYLSRPVSRAGNDPVAMIDSMVLQKEGVTCLVTEEQLVRSVIINFPAQSEQKQIEYRIDRQTGYLLSITNVIRSDRMGEAAPPKPGDPPQYAIVEALFTNHHTGEVDAGIFDVNRYFRKQGREYFTVAPYERYKIMLGSPDM